MPSAALQRQHAAALTAAFNFVRTPLRELFPNELALIKMYDCLWGVVQRGCWPSVSYRCLYGLCVYASTYIVGCV